jgi:hypothetical protein
MDRQARRHGGVFRVLVQVNTARESGKFGLLPEEVGGFLREVAGLKGLQVEGLMVMAPFSSDPEEVRPVFRETRALFGRLARETGVTMRYLSMGMSGDYPVAVEEGANLVRVGTAIFGPRECMLKEG